MLVCLLLALGVGACWTAQPPPNVRTLVLTGSAYERGFQHGQAFAWDIRSLYTRLLTNALVPSLNQEQSSIAPVLGIYYDDRYMGGQFSYQMLVESAWHLWDEGYIPDTYKDELRGLSDGAGLPMDEVLVLNTFMDTLLGFRAVSLFIQELQKPRIDVVEIPGLEGDGADNDGDGATDEAGEGTLDPYEPTPWATLLEIPTDARLRLVMSDVFLGGLSCVDLQNVEPIGDKEIDRACVRDACLLPGCADLPVVTRECLTWTDYACVEPKVPFACFDPMCVEIIDPECVDPDSLRVQVGDDVYTRQTHPDVVRTTLLPLPEGEVYDPQGPGEGYPHARRCQGPLEVVFAPPRPLPEAAVVSIAVQAQDQSQVYIPAPIHGRNMRDERLTFTTRGYHAATGLGAALHDVTNTGPVDGRNQPMPLAFGVRGDATTDGQPLMAHHYALVDGDVVHEHAVLFLQIPDEGEGLPHAYVGWTGLLWGFNGMNSAGVAYGVNHSDTLDNPLVGGVVEAILERLAVILKDPDLSGLSQILGDVQLFAANLPLGFTGREILARSRTVADALEVVYRGGQAYGWNWLLADGDGGLLVAETDGATDPKKKGKVRVAEQPRQEDGFRFYGPDPTDSANLDAWGRPLASVGPNDLRASAHYVANANDSIPVFLATFTPKHQRWWSSTYYRSLRTFHRLGEEIATRLPRRFDVPAMIDLLRTPDLVDQRDSMSAVVFEPARRVMHWAVGQVPATSGAFQALDLRHAIETRSLP